MQGRTGGQPWAAGALEGTLICGRSRFHKSSALRGRSVVRLNPDAVIGGLPNSLLVLQIQQGWNRRVAATGVTSDRTGFHERRGPG